MVAAGSGGTCAGLALGLALAGAPTRMHAYSVCDSPAEFHRVIGGSLLPGLGAPAALRSEALLRITDAAGAGYAASSDAELRFIRDVMRDTGVCLDPVYAGKAAFAMARELRERREAFAGADVLFVHTGGQPGLYDKTAQLQPLLTEGGYSTAREWRPSATTLAGAAGR